MTDEENRDAEIHGGEIHGVTSIGELGDQSCQGQRTESLD